MKQYNQVFETKMTLKSKIPALGWKTGGTGTQGELWVLSDGGNLGLQDMCLKKQNNYQKQIIAFAGNHSKRDGLQTSKMLKNLQVCELTQQVTALACGTHYPEVYKKWLYEKYLCELRTTRICLYSLF